MLFWWQRQDGEGNVRTMDPCRLAPTHGPQASGQSRSHGHLAQKDPQVTELGGNEN